MDEVLSVKFIKEENNVDRDSLRVEGEFMSRIIFSNKNRTELKLISMRYSNEITIKGSFSGAYGDSLWVQNEHTDLIEYKYKEGVLKKQKRVEVNDTARVLLDKIFIQKNGRLSIHDLLMNEVFSMKSNGFILSETHFLVRRDHEVILYTVEGLTEVRRVPVKDKYEIFLVGEDILIITENILKIIRNTEITVNLSIDIDEDMDDDVNDMIKDEDDFINNGYIIKECKNIGPIKCMLIIGHRQSVDIEYIIVNESTAQKYQLEEESDGLSVPLMHTLINMYVLESTVLESINQEDKEIIQGPTIAVETNLNVYLYGMVLDVSDPSKYISTRRNKEHKIELDEPIITYKDSSQSPEESHPRSISESSENEESSTTISVPNSSEEVNYNTTSIPVSTSEEELSPSGITDKEVNNKTSISDTIITHDKDSSFSNTDTRNNSEDNSKEDTNKSVSPLTLLSLSNLVPHTSSDKDTKPVEDQPVNESSNSLFNKPVDMPDIKPSNKPVNESSNSLFNKPDTKPSNSLFNKPVDKPDIKPSNKPVKDQPDTKPAEDKPDTKSVDYNMPSDKPDTKPSNSLFNMPSDMPGTKPVYDNTLSDESMTDSSLDISDSVSDSVMDKSNNPTEEDFLNYSLKNLNIKKEKKESSVKKTVLLDIPVRNSPMKKIEDMLDGLDNSFKNPIVSVKNDIQEIREVSHQCKRILQSIEVFDVSDKEVSVKNILSGVEEAIILVKDQLSHLTQEVEDRKLIQEKVSALLVLIQCRLNKMEEVISTSPPDYSKEIEYINTRISKIFNISTYTMGKSEDQISPNSISIYSKPLELGTDQIHKIEESIILPPTRDSTLSMLTECFKKLCIHPAQVSSVQDISLIDRIFSTEAEQTFLKTIQARGSNNSKESINPIPIKDLSQTSTQSVSNTSQTSTSTQNNSLFSQTSTPSQSVQTSTSTPSSGSIFSQQSTPSQTSTHNNSLFSQSTPTGGSIFGQSNQTSTSTPSGGLFGQSTPSQSGQSSTQNNSLFSQSVQTSTPNQPVQQSTSSNGSLFSQTSQMNTSSNPLFSQASQQTVPTSSSLFSQSTQTGSIFSQSNQPSQQSTPSSSLFGQSNQSTSGGSLFGQPSQSTPTGSIFGQSTQPNQSSSLFGQSNQPTPTGSIFGQSNQPTSGGFNSGIFSQQSNPSFNLLQRQSNPFTQGNSKLGLGSSSNTSSLFKKPSQEQ